jgi:ectoine hydroxylase-related dioxygenase (phytanoyl-CoA dioxygenase family)
MLTSMAALSPAQHRSFRDTGFLVIPGFFTEAEVDAVSGAYDTVWRDRPNDVVVDTEVSMRRVRAVNMTEQERREPFKVNDLYLRDVAMREATLSKRLGTALRELLADEPVICNTLSLEYGSQQADHLDTLFMTPRTDGRLVASWMALEDVQDDAGPLRYFPESNHIEPYRFGDGTFHVVEPEMPRWSDYMATQVDRHGLAETRFLAKRGDLFLWDAWLLHGGSEICTPGLTRSSLVTHFFTKSDCLAMGSDLRKAPGGWWMRRPAPTPRDGEEASALSPTIEDTPAAEIPHLGAPPTGAPLPARDLRERFEALDPAGDRVGP